MSTIFLITACLCNLGIEIGCSKEIIDKFERVLKIDTLAKLNRKFDENDDYHFEMPTLSSTIIMERSDTTENLEEPLQIFTEGSVALLVSSCVDYWYWKIN